MEVRGFGDALKQSAHRRWNPVYGNWVLNSPHRGQRPWRGSTETTRQVRREHFDPTCYLCPGNSRTSGQINPQYQSTFVFDNDFPALCEITAPFPQPFESDYELLKVAQSAGVCRVICYSPDHGRDMADMTVPEISSVIATWQLQFKELSANPGLRHVMIFENRGALMGSSNPHPHGQIWATDHVPSLPLRGYEHQSAFYQKSDIPLLHAYLQLEKREGERIVFEETHWLAVVPFWAAWPFEVWLLPKTAVGTIEEMTDAQRESWALSIKALLERYDALFGAPFPYSMGIFQQPVNQTRCEGFVFHQVFYPPLLRSASVRKFMVGYELCAEPQRDISPEEAALKLREAR